MAQSIPKGATVIGEKGGTKFFVGGTSAAPSAPSTPAATSKTTSSSASSKASYGDLVNVGGEIRNTKTGVAYSTPTQLASDLGVSSNAINWGAIKPGQAQTAETVGPKVETKIKVTPEAKINAGDLLGEQITTGNVSGIAQDVNQKYLEYQKALRMPVEEVRAQERINELNNTLRQLSTEQVARESALKIQPAEVGQAIVGRQIAALNQYIAAKQLPLINEIQAQTEIVKLYQQQQDQIIKQMQVGLDQGKFNVSLAKEYEQRKYEEQQATVKLAQTLGVSSRYMSVSGVVKDTVTGESLSLPEFQRRTGQVVGAPEAATNFSMVTDLTTAKNEAALKGVVTDLATKYWDAGVQPTDSLDTARAKIRANSAIYKKDINIRGDGSSEAKPMSEAEIKQNVNVFYNNQLETWKKNGIIQGNGKISSTDYIKAKQYWKEALGGYVANVGNVFDNMFSNLVDKYKSPTKDNPRTDIENTSWQKDYQIESTK